MDGDSEKLKGNIKRVDKAALRKLEDVYGIPNSPSTSPLIRPEDVIEVYEPKKTR